MPCELWIVNIYRTESEGGDDMQPSQQRSLVLVSRLFGWSTSDGLTHSYGTYIQIQFR
jgi:hypothetical protein